MSIEDRIEQIRDEMLSGALDKKTALGMLEYLHGFQKRERTVAPNSSPASMKEFEKAWNVHHKGVGAAGSVSIIESKEEGAGFVFECDVMLSETQVKQIRDYWEKHWAPNPAPKILICDGGGKIRKMPVTGTATKQLLEETDLDWVVHIEGMVKAAFATEMEADVYCGEMKKSNPLTTVSTAQDFLNRIYA